ncbi:MAG TPA: hypothetical protein VFW85_09310, partial [Gaiellaceae bacterium]|nr:hypothetical protein [Gaiellaceae bacterium]
GLLPDRTFVVLVDPAVASARAGASLDRIEQAGPDFMTRADACYRRLVADQPGRFVGIDGERTPEEIAEEVRANVHDLL